MSHSIVSQRSVMTTDLDDRLHTYAPLWLVVPEGVEYLDRSLPTASWYDRYVLEAGRYPVELVNISGGPWNPDLSVPTPGFVKNVGPYYAKVSVDATLIESYRVNRLLSASSSSLTKHASDMTLTRTVYAYEALPGRPMDGFGTFAERVILPEPMLTR